MTDLTGSATIATSCPLLDKLAPETRIKIYGHVLTFGAPVKHVKNMRPFFGKTTAGRAPGKTTEAAWCDATDPLHYVNTSILSTNKIIYMEAIKVFYENNTIQFNIPDSVLKLRDSARLRETDLSLAIRVTTKNNLEFLQFGPQRPAFENAVLLPPNQIPRICPSLQCNTMYIYTDHAGLFIIAQSMRGVPYLKNISFEGVGKVTASVKGRPEQKFFVLCTRAIERWESQRLPRCSHSYRASARCFYDHSREGCEGRDETFHYARDMVDNLSGQIVPTDYPAISDDSHEFWTVVDHILGLSDHDDETPEIDLAIFQQISDLNFDDEDDAQRAVALVNELFGGKKGGDDALPEP